jgi:hypothetical protein
MVVFEVFVGFVPSMSQLSPAHSHNARTIVRFCAIYFSGVLRVNSATQTATHSWPPVAHCPYSQRIRWSASSTPIMSATASLMGLSPAMRLSLSISRRMWATSETRHSGELRRGVRALRPLRAGGTVAPVFGFRPIERPGLPLDAEQQRRQAWPIRRFAVGRSPTFAGR